MSSSPPTNPRRAVIARLLNLKLSTKLLLLVAALVALVGALVSVATAAAMTAYLNGQLDTQVVAAFNRQAGPNQVLAHTCPIGITDSSNIPRGVLAQSSGELIARPGCAFVVAADDFSALDNKVLQQLSGINADGRPHSIWLNGLGHYRVIVANGLAVGLSLRNVDEAVHNLVVTELELTLAGVAFAMFIASELIRRTLQPLRKVAATAIAVTAQPLAHGEPSIAARVPDHLTDNTTEVGQVGAALNTLLSHVDDALTARHQSEQRARQFVADASHELRTPLATIQGYAELSRRAPSPPEALTAALAKVETEAHRMSALVEDLLLLARLDSGRPLEYGEVDMTHMLLEAVADNRILAPHHRWQLALPEEPISVWGDSARLHQVITNLLANARQHTPAGTQVTITASRVGDAVRVEIHDNGPGLPADLVPQAFERFTRGDSSRTRSSGGAGLGLSLVAAITEALGGTVRVASEPGSTTFTLTLPTKGAPAASDA